MAVTERYRLIFESCELSRTFRIDHMDNFNLFQVPYVALPYYDTIHIGGFEFYQNPNHAGREPCVFTSRGVIVFRLITGGTWWNAVLQDFTPFAGKALGILL